MERFLRSKVLLTMVTLVLLAGAIAISLSSTLVHSRAASGSTGLQLQQKWIYTTGGTFVSSGVSYNGRLYVTSAYDVSSSNDYVLVSGIDEAKGNVTWQKKLPFSNITVTPDIYNGNLYVTDGTNIQVFNADNDQLPIVWSQPGGEFTVANGVVYSYTRSQVYAYDAANGNLLWQQNHNCNGDAPIVANGLVYLDSCGGYFGDSIVALSTQDGSLQWYQTGACHNGPIDQIIGTSTFVGNGFVYALTESIENNLCYHHGITAFNAANGTSAWSITFPGGSPNVSEINVANGIVYVSINDNSQSPPTYTLYAVDGTSGTILWNQPTPGGSSLTTIDNGTVYGVSGIALYAWDSQTGTSLYANANIANLTSSISLQAPFVVDNILYLWDTSGILYAFGIGQQGTPTPSPSPTPPPNRQVLFIILQGINSQLTKQEIAHNPVGTALGSVGSTLENKFPKAKFVEFSYGGSLRNGTPKPYLCDPTFINPILTDIQLLNAQIANAVGSNHNTDIYLVGHSLGGVIAFGYLALLEDHLNGVSLPSGAQLKAVVTLDSPLGGVYGNQYAYFSKYIATNYLTPNKQVISNYPCKGLVGKKTPLTTIDDLVRVYNSQNNGGTTPPDDPGNDPLGATASIEAILGVTQPPPPLPFLPSNEIIAQSAHTDLGTSVLSIGNMADYLWNPAPCAPFVVPLSSALAAAIAVIPNFNSTQFQEDQGNGSSFYGRSINTASICDAATLGNALNHNDVLVNSAALNGLVNFLSPVGSTPIPLAVEPYQP